MTLAEAERVIVQYLIDTGYIGVKAIEVATRILYGQPLSESDRAVLQREIADRWFRVECEQCFRLMPIEEIPHAIAYGDVLCAQCRGLEGSAILFEPLPGEKVMGQLRYVDGACRLVFQDESGRQYVVDDEGGRVPGQWLNLEHEADECVVVELRN